MSVLEKDIWELKDTHLIVIPTNLIGVMGKGLAKQCADRYPYVAKWYRDVCHENWFEKGKPLPMVVQPDCALVMLPTKNHWRDMASLEMISAGLYNLAAFLPTYISRGVPRKRIAMPMLGAGLGGLDPSVSVHLMCTAIGSPVTSNWYDLLKPVRSLIETKYPKAFRSRSKEDGC